MAQGCDFEGANVVLRAPEGMTQDECYDLPVHSSDGKVVSAWRLSDDELRKVQETGIIWFSCMSSTHPPVMIGADAPIHVFNEETGEFVREPHVEPVRHLPPKRADD